MADEKKRQELINILKNIQHITGVCYLKEDARKLFEDWYGQLSNMKGNGRVQPFLHRLQIYTLKFSIIYSIMDEMGTKISKSSMLSAIEKCTELCKSMTVVENEDIIFGRVQINMRKIIQYLKKHGNSSKSTLLQNTKLSSKEFNEAIETLIDSERVSSKKIQTSRKPVTLYSLEEKVSQ